MRFRHLLASGLLTLPLLAVTATEVAAADVEITVDCITDAGTSFDDILDAGSNLIINHTNCDFVSIYDGTDWLAPVVPDNPLVLSSIEGADLFADGYDLIGIYPDVVYPETTPRGVLGLTADLTIEADPLVIDLSEETEDGDHWLGGSDICAVSVGDHVYATREIVISKPGRYTFRNITTDPIGGYESDTDHPIEDPFMALYSSFDPANPDVGVVGCNDDLNDRFGYDNIDMFGERLADGSIMEGHRPYFYVNNLPAGTYTLFYTTYDDITYDEWVSGDGGDFEPGPATGTFEMWGPDASICDSSDTDCVEEQANANELPATGSTPSTTLWLGMMALVVGGGLVIATRRSARRA